ncbi:predicted protein [Naegleria gruberi]|uniref:Calcium-transporting ATPase n=1 Tax=Naegleria gruberi TaxID=5762 RepID=D2W237_NAEGR|nr:uncharacterized protein NAEGRDRAFT_75449 [Naegleria gruberi]EFC36876.1 predicted protein [Naegleria gruberi]|eukprot:XP_002669620.1 predicted protein [Naegleria gruberi strain NEG-M]
MSSVEYQHGNEVLFIKKGSSGESTNNNNNAMTTESNDHKAQELAHHGDSKDEHVDSQHHHPKGPFTLTADELSEMHQNKDLKGLQKMGGMSGLMRDLKTDAKRGIAWKSNYQSYDERTNLYGLNVYPEPPAKGLFKIFFEALSDETHIILMIFAFISMVLGLAFPESEEERPIGWIDSFAIYIAVAIVCVVTTANDYSKEKKFKNLSRESKKVMVKVIRDGENFSVLTDDIRVGDIVEIEQGDGIPADGLCIESNHLKTDESVMTGEPDLIKKNTTELIFLLSGCTVAEGSGKMLVTGVGVGSEWGRTLQSLKEANEEQRETPLEAKLDKLAINIGKVGTAFAIGTVTILILAFWIKKLMYTSTWVEASSTFEETWQEKNVVDVVKYFIIALTIVVVAVPEGLPLAVTIALAYSVRKMMKDQNLVRHLAACETMGGANNICSDKTGTLTLNQMRVTQAYFGDRFFGEQLSSILLTLKSPLLQVIIDGIVANSKANLVKGDDNNKNKEYATQGSKTEAALLLLLVKHLNQTIDSYKDRRNELLSEERGSHLQLPFNSNLKRMSTIVTNSEGETRYRLFTKGASEIVLKLCSYHMASDGSLRKMDSEKEAEMMKCIEDMANQGLRTICLAYRDVNPEVEFSSRADEENYLENIDPVTLEQDLVCIGIVGIKDPLRPEVPAAIEQCKKSGITVRMITGDNILTAKYIARECGILSKDGIAIEGPTFRKMTPEQIDEILPKLQVMARSSPTDKFILVKHLRKKGNVVAVTGDGTNDAPALKEADVGLSMGLSGTQVAKEASDIIILDDNFSSIVKSVLWGRSIYENIRKFLVFQLTVNVVALILTIVSAVSSAFQHNSSYRPPLSPVQMLWINLIMDTFAALALATEPPIPELLDRKPHGRKDSLITMRMWTFIAAESIFQLTVMFTLFYGATSFRGLSFSLARNDAEMRTIIFNAFVFCQVFNQFNARKINFEYDIFRGVFKSFWFIGITIMIFILQIAIINFAYYDPILIGLGKNDGLTASNFTQTIPLNWYQWAITISIGFISIPYGFLVRFVSRMFLKLLSLKKNNRQITSDGYEETYSKASE